MTEYTAKRVILKDTQGNYLIPYVGNTGGAIVGSTFFSPTPINDANVHLLDGGIVAKTGIYEEFYNKFITPLKTSNPELFVTDTAHAQEIAQHKVTNKFVDNADNIRLPKFGEYNFTVNEQISAQGNGMSLGLTNGTQYTTIQAGGSALVSEISKYGEPVGTSAKGGSAIKDDTTLGITPDPTKSGIEANLQSNLKGYWYIIISSTSKTDIQTNLDNVTADLNNKADRDLLNTPDNVDMVIEHKISPDGNWYRKWKSGLLEQWGILDSGGSDKYHIVTFPKPYKTLPKVNIQEEYTGTRTEFSYSYIRTNSITTTQFETSYRSSSRTYWYACGQGV